MDQHWGDWPDDDYSGDADTADLNGPDEPLGGHAYDPGGDHTDAGTPAADGSDERPPADGGGYLDDDPMAGFGHDGDHDAGASPDNDPGGDSDPDSDIAPIDAGLDGHPDDGDPGGDGPGAGDHDAADHTDDPHADAGPSTETVVGADPDVDPAADWSPADFPEDLQVTPPEPVDGYPWSDASAVAGPGTGDGDPAATPTDGPPAEDLLDYAGSDGNGGDPWTALLGSDDPATSSLGRWWAPGT